MPYPDNAPRFDDLNRLAISDIAALPPEMLLALQRTALTESARVKRVRDRLEAGIAQRYEAAVATERTAQAKTSGIVRVEDEGVIIIADLPKKVTWDQDRLAAMAERIRAGGENPTQYLEIAYRVSERRYGAWPEALREGFADARTETTGKPIFRLEPRDR